MSGESRSSARRRTPTAVSWPPTWTSWCWKTSYSTRKICTTTSMQWTGPNTWPNSNSTDRPGTAMQWSDISFAPPSRILRQFAGLWLIFFGGLACWQGFLEGNQTAALVLAALALAVGPLGLLRPQAVRPLFVAWMVLAFPIGWAVSRVLLAFLYYGIFTPVGLV